VPGCTRSYSSLPCWLTQSISQCVSAITSPPKSASTAWIGYALLRKMMFLRLMKMVFLRLKMVIWWTWSRNRWSTEK
jgi:hypothetical protein